MVDGPELAIRHGDGWSPAIASDDRAQAGSLVAHRTRVALQGHTPVDERI
jgi:hypothetical protein